MKSHETQQILDLMAQLNAKAQVEKASDAITEQEYNELMNSLQSLSTVIYKKPTEPETDTERMDLLTEMMTSISKLDFSKEAIVGEEGGVLDYIAMGLNLMNQQLRKQFKHLALYQQAFNAIPTPLLIIDRSGSIQATNTAANALIGTNGLSGSGISSFLSQPAIDSLLEKGKEALSIPAILKARPDRTLAMDLYLLKDQEQRHHGYVVSLCTESKAKFVPDIVTQVNEIAVTPEPVTLPSKGIYGKLQALMNNYKYWDEWRLSAEFEQLGYTERELLILENFILHKGNFEQVCATFDISAPRLKQIVDKTFRKLSLNHSRYQQWVLTNKLTIPFSKMDLDKFKDQIIFTLTRNIFKNYPEVTEEFFTANMLEADLAHFDLSEALVEALHEEDCYSLKDVLTKYDDPAHELSQLPHFNPKLVAEFEQFMQSVLP